jgi:aspartyl-tRNA(Asn)/glutamyl-tRNA(Gln) amidotransferase subunit B
MKGYQISQFDLPLAVDGSLEIEVEGRIRRIGIERVHLEEDVAKLQHVNPADGASSYSLVDVNRSGTPLMEIVSKPDLRSAEEARVYLTTLHSVVQYLGVSAANLQEGNFRCDANVSIRPAGATEYGTRTEVKNMNSFRSVYLALKYEVERQRRIVEGGGKVIQETRGWVDDRNVTVAQRSKEHAHDYRYFPEPDLPPLLIESVWVERVRRQLPELAAQRKARFMQQLGLSEYDARLLTSSRAMADYFENALSRKRLDASALESFAKNLGNWVLGDFSRWLNLTGQEIAEAKVTPAGLVELIDLIESGVLSVAMGKSVLAEAFASGDSPGKIVLEKGYSQLSDTAEVESAVANAIEDNPRAVEDYHSGKESAAGFLVGQVMKLTRGRAKPDLVQKLIRDSLESSRAP